MINNLFCCCCFVSCNVSSRVLLNCIIDIDWIILKILSLLELFSGY